MISDEQREFIDSLSDDQVKSLLRRLEAYAKRALGRRTRGGTIAEPADVVGWAFDRLLSDEYAQWFCFEPTEEALLEYLADRVDDIVRNLSPDRLREQCAYDSHLHDYTRTGPPHLRPERPSAEFVVMLQERADRWFELAADQDELLGELVLEHLALNDDAAAQAEALGIHRTQVYRLRTQAACLLREVDGEE